MNFILNQMEMIVMVLKDLGVLRGSEAERLAFGTHNKTGGKGNTPKAGGKGNTLTAGGNGNTQQEMKNLRM